MSASDPVRCLDLTRTISRVGRGPPTGIDRVERAYLRQLLADPTPLYALVRTWLGYLLLDQSGATEVLARLDGQKSWGPADTFAHFQRKAHPMKRRAEADLRRLAIGRAPKARLTRLLKRTFPGRVTYMNVGHSNLLDEVLSGWKSLEQSTVVVLVHDTIPLDHPAWQRPGTVGAFEDRMRAVATNADMVLCISAETQKRVSHWFTAFGRLPKTVVAPIGIDLTLPDKDALPKHLPPPGPYFVSVGTIEPRKNHNLLLDIWDELAGDHDDVPTLVIAGARGWRNEDLFQRLDAKPPNVVEVSGLSDGALTALLEGAAGLLFPSRAEGFGLPPAEALALGVPALCSDLPVFHEILGHSAIYADADDMYLWKQTILRLAGRFGAEETETATETGGFRAPSWAEHFNLVLNLV